MNEMNQLKYNNHFNQTIVKHMYIGYKNDFKYDLLDLHAKYLTRIIFQLWKNSIKHFLGEYEFINKIQITFF